MLEINILKLALGTASFGMDYGLFNSSGQLKLQQVKRILELARTRSIKTLDTASSYGKSENILGQIEVSDWDIITKVSPVPNGILSVYDWIVSEVEKSLSRLRVTNIHGLLLHKTSDLKQNYGKEIWSALEHLKKSGIVQKIGYSIYETSELDDFWSNFKPDIVQAPLNIIDRRMIQSGWLRKLYNEGCEIHVRSIFLQGVLLADKAMIPNYFKTWNNIWDNYHDWLLDVGISPLEACLAFATSQNEISKVIVGVNNLSHLEEILNLRYRKAYNPPDKLFSVDKNLLNPSLWRLK